MKYERFKARVKKFFTKKKIIWTVVLVLVLVLMWFIFGRQKSPSNIQVGLVKTQDIEKTVLTTGQVVSKTDLDLSFQTSGVVRAIYVKEGDVVSAGATLAILDQSNARAALTSAEGSLAQATANLNKIKAAATSEDVAVSIAAVDSAKTALSNAKQNLKNELLTAFTSVETVVLSDTNILFSNSQSLSPQYGIPGTVNTNPELVSKVNSDRTVINSTLESWKTTVSNITDQNTDQVVNSSLSSIDLVGNYLTNIISLLTTYTQITGGGSQSTVTTYATNVAGGKSSVESLRSAIVTYNQAIKTTTSALAQAEATLALKKAPPRPEDLGIAEAQVMSAQGGVDNAKANLNNTVIVAPTAGTITQLDIKLGEQAQATKEVIKIQNVGELHTEAQVSEADIASIAVGQTIDYTFDALGPDKHFASKVLTVNPASTVVSGVVNYKVTGSLQNIAEVKPGMTANMTILVSKKQSALVVPSSSIINRDGKKLVRVINDPKLKTYDEVMVTTGLEADGGLVEILSGLTDGQNIVTYMK